MVGDNLKEEQLSSIVSKAMQQADKDGDGKLSFNDFTSVSDYHTLLI